MALKQLGNKTAIPASPDEAILERIPIEMKEIKEAVIRFSCPEFTSLCLTGDTLIDVCCDETIYPKGIAIKELVGTEGHVFSFDPSSRKPVVKKYHDVRKTQSAVPVISIEMLSIKGTAPHSTRGKVTIKLTPDHLVLVIRGWHGYEWVPAGKLKPGDRIFSDQRSADGIRNSFRHALIAECLYGRKLHADEDTHHINGNHYDNTPTNIEIKSDHEHFSLHQKMRYGYDLAINTDDLVKLYESDPCISITDIAREYGCDYSTIESRLKGKTKIKTQREILIARRPQELENAMRECAVLYEQGYTTNELSLYFEVNSSTISVWLEKKNIVLRKSNDSRKLRKSVELPSLNHSVISISDAGTADVFNMEVEDTACFFANEIVVHNCPVTGQPDFARFYIDYIPDKYLLESKSLKLFLSSFRNVGSFHEEVTAQIGSRFCASVEPTWARVTGIWFARGGIPIDVFWQRGVIPANTYIPQLKIFPYTGRM